VALSAEEAPVEHQPALSRFAIVDAAGTAVLDYRREGRRLVALHTGVPEPLRGRGLAARLTAALLAWCRAEGLELLPQCSYTAAYLHRHGGAGGAAFAPERDDAAGGNA
jgi:uncharacterized protein